MARVKHLKHGKRGTRAYYTWSAMIQRCCNKCNPGYKNYGGRGITVCQRWRQFANFYADMGDPPPGFSLERRDNDRGYSSRNCCWATRKEQNRNTRRSHKLKLADEVLTVAELAERSGMDYSTLSARLRRGLSPEQAAQTPLKRIRGTFLTHGGQTLSVSAWARTVGLEPGVLHARLRRGLTLEEALQLPFNYKERRCRGERSPHAKLTQQQVLEIRNSTASRTDLMREYSLSRSQVRRIQLGETWAQLAS